MGKLKVFITGDIADKTDYSGLAKFIQNVISAIKLSNDKERIFWAVGNHDIKRGRKLQEDIIYRIRENKSEKFHKALLNDEKRLLLTNQGMYEYYEK